MHKLLAKQFAKARGAHGQPDLDKLSDLVSAAYDEADQDRRRTERSISLMIEELDQLSSRDREKLLTELRIQNHRFETAIENMSHGLCMFDAEQRLIVCNKLYSEMYKLSPELTKPGTTLRQILQWRVENKTHQGDPQTYIENTIAKVSARQPYFRILELWDGRVIADTHRPMSSGGWVSTHQDITEQRRSDQRFQEQNETLREHEERLRVQNIRFDAALRHMSQGLCMFDGEKKLIVCNHQWLDLFGLPGYLAEPGTTLTQVLEARLAAGHYPGRTLEELVAERAALHKDRQPKMFEQHLRDGRIVQTYHQPMPEGGWVATFEDITERRRAEAQIAHMSRHDALTDLPNRVLFREHMEQNLARVRRGEALAVLCLDLDNFKNINDSLGHAAGDAVLQAVAGRLRECVRETDTVARLGGDEFAVLQVGAKQPTHATTLAQRIVDALGRPFDVAGHQFMIGSSVGIAVSPTDGDGPDQLLNNADLALYRVKQDGRNGFRFFEPAMDAEMKVRRSLELDLRKALAQGEFELFYQPVINLKENKIRGFEALLRWRHPERGMISPADFIPLSEEIGLIIPLGEWVLRKACAEAATWSSAVTVAVNLSPVQFKSKNLVATVVAALAASHLPPTRLEVEITETVLMQDNEEILDVLLQLRALGVRISMDDFGTGYSSLSYLRRFPFDKIKIDRSFVRDLAVRGDSLSIVRAVTGLGTSLGMATTAEGVETAEQLQVLRAEGCTEVQGYVFSPPRPAREIEALLDEFGGETRAVA